MTGRPKDKVGNDVPGPGHHDYNYTVVKNKVVTYKMSNSKKKDIVSNEAK